MLLVFSVILVGINDMVICFMYVNVFYLFLFAFSFCLYVGVVTDMGVDECYEMWVFLMCRMIFFV